MLRLRQRNYRILCNKNKICLESSNCSDFDISEAELLRKSSYTIAYNRSKMYTHIIKTNEIICKDKIMMKIVMDLGDKHTNKPY